MLHPCSCSDFVVQHFSKCWQHGVVWDVLEWIGYESASALWSDHTHTLQCSQCAAVSVLQSVCCSQFMEPNNSIPTAGRRAETLHNDKLTVNWFFKKKSNSKFHIWKKNEYFQKIQSLCIFPLSGYQCCMIRLELCVLCWQTAAILLCSVGWLTPYTLQNTHTHTSTWSCQHVTLEIITIMITEVLRK